MANTTTSNSTIPDVVAEWIVSLKDLRPVTLQDLRYRGLDALLVTDLKKLLIYMHQLNSVSNNNNYDLSRSTSGLKKAELIQRVRSCFYVDAPLCNTVDDNAIVELRMLMERQSDENTGPSISTNHNNNINNNNINNSLNNLLNNHYLGGTASSLQLQQLHQDLVGNAAGGNRLNFNNFFMQAPAAGAAASFTSGDPLYLMSAAASASASASGATHDGGTSGSGVKRGFHSTFGPASSSSPPVLGGNIFDNGIGGGGFASASASASAAASSQHNYSPTTSGRNNPDETPQNQHEARLLKAVSEMGLPNPNEILVSIRKLASKKCLHMVTSEEVMLDVIASREEASEAAIMDEARRRSEEQNEVEKEQQRFNEEQQLEERLRNSTLGEWIQESKMFKDSWLLGKSSVYTKFVVLISEDCTDLKIKLIELLKLEKQARKWYNDLPKAYFTFEVADRLVQAKPVSVKDVQCEVDKLQKAMFSLTEQENGRPSIMLQAIEKHSQVDNEIDQVWRVNPSSPGGTTSSGGGGGGVSSSSPLRAV